MTIKQISVTIIKKKSDTNQNTVPIVIGGGAGQWENLYTKQQIIDKFNAYEVAVTPSVDFGLISTNNYKLKIEDNMYKLYAMPNDPDPFNYDFSFVRTTENEDVKTMAIAIYYQFPNLYLDQISSTHKVNYTLQMTCDLAMKENRGLTLKIDTYLTNQYKECISSLWRYGIENNVSDDTSTPQQRLITKLFNKL